MCSAIKENAPKDTFFRHGSPSDVLPFSIFSIHSKCDAFFNLLTEIKINKPSVFFNSCLQIRSEIMLRVFVTHLITWWFKWPLFFKEKTQKLECWELKVFGLVCFRRVKESLLEYMNCTLHYIQERAGLFHRLQCSSEIS